MQYFKYILFLFLATIQLGYSQEPSASIAIIGSGAAGIMALKRAVIGNHKVLFFTGAKEDQKKSRGNWARNVANIPGLERYRRTIVELREDVLKSISKQKFRKNLRIIRDSIKQVQKKDDLFTLQDASGKSYTVKYVILATGVQGEYPDIGGTPYQMMEYAKKGNIFHCILCDGYKSEGKNVTVLGHTEAAAYMAIRLCDQYNTKKVTLLTNGQKAVFTEDTKDILKSKNIALFEDKIKNIFGENKLEGFELQNKKISSRVVFLSLGMRPNNQLALQVGAEINRKGFVEVNQNNESSIENFFVVGDLCNTEPKQIHVAWQHSINAITIIGRRQEDNV